MTTNTEKTLEPNEQPKAEERPKERRPRGFAAMDRARVIEIARKGGKAAHAAGTAHEFDAEEAKVAGRKGGLATHEKYIAAKTKTEPPPAPEAAEHSDDKHRDVA